MCLHQITKRYDPPIDLIAYKVVMDDGDGQLTTNMMLAKLELGQTSTVDGACTLPASVYDRCGQPKRYRAGFHCYPRVRDAHTDCWNGEVVVRCQARGIHTRGMEGTAQVVVASSITPLEILPD